MSKILIAYNNDSTTDLHDFFESSGDEARQISVDNQIDYIHICPPDLNKSNIIQNLSDCNICFIATHGDGDGIYNENNEELVSVNTDNYHFNGKCLYTIACSCAQNLLPNLKNCGLSIFVGYRNAFIVRGEREPFITCAMAGLKNLLHGNNLQLSKKLMLETFDKHISDLDACDPFAAMDLLHNKESLIFEGEDSLLLSDLL